MEWEATIEYSDGTIHNIKVYGFAASIIDGITRYYIEYFDYTIDSDGLDMFSEIYLSDGVWYKVDTGLTYSDLCENVYVTFSPDIIGDHLPYKKIKKLYKK